MLETANIDDVMYRHNYNIYFCKLLMDYRLHVRLRINGFALTIVAFCAHEAVIIVNCGEIRSPIFVTLLYPWLSTLHE